jgi:hypothetical protein
MFDETAPERCLCASLCKASEAKPCVILHWLCLAQATADSGAGAPDGSGGAFKALGPSLASFASALADTDSLLALTRLKERGPVVDSDEDVDGARTGIKVEHIFALNVGGSKERQYSRALAPE